MNVSFVAIGSEQLPISLLSSIAKLEGHKVSLAFTAALFNDRYQLEFPSIAKYFDDTDDIVNQLISQKPDVVAFSSLTSTFQWMIGVAERIKKYNSNVKIVFGGVHPSAVPDLVLSKPCVDYVVIGEGDIAFPKIIDSITNRSNDPIVNTRYKDVNGNIVKGLQAGFIQDLDQLPFFDKVIWEDHFRVGDKFLTMASRGCPFRCSFCFNNFFAQLPEVKKNKYVRQRSPEHMMEELRIGKKRYNLKWVEFQDDVFTVRKDWLHEFLPMYKKEIGVPFQCLTHPGYFDEEVAELLKEAGCEWVQMGIQTMDEEFKYQHLKRYEDSEKIYKALEASNKFKLKMKVDHMFGLPGEPMDAQEKARELYLTHRPDRIQTFWTCYLPGTDLMKQAIKDNLLSDDQVYRINEGIDFYFYRKMENIKDANQVDFYARYELLFRIYPLFPSWFNKKIKPSMLKFFPPKLMQLIGMLLDIINGFVKGNQDFTFYANHYIFQLWKFFLKKTKINVNLKGTKPRSDDDFVARFKFYNSKTENSQQTAA